MYGVADFIIDTSHVTSEDYVKYYEESQGDLFPNYCLHSYLPAHSHTHYSKFEIWKKALGKRDKSNVQRY